MARKTKKYCWVWKMKPECCDEYDKMHGAPWDSIMKAHSKAGFKNYSIFRNGTEYIYEFECDADKNPEDLFAATDNDPDCKKWNSISTPMVDRDLHGQVGGGVEFLKEVFYLE